VSAPRTVELLRDLDRPTGWVLLVDGVEQSYVDTEDPTHLEFEYMQHLALVVDVAHPRPAPVRAVHLGGGAMALPRWAAVTRPGSTQLVVEVAADVIAAVAPLGAVPGVSLAVGDAMSCLAAVEPASVDLLVWDLYDGPRAVTSSITDSTVALMARTLRQPGGLVALNVSDKRPFDVVRGVIAALQAAFADVLLLAEPSTLRGRRSGNCVVAAGFGVLPADRIAALAASAAVRGRVVAGADLLRFVDDAPVPTDDAPLPPPDESRGRGFL
jgi:spermidine synthase